MQNADTVIVWFRQDLRLQDNLALVAAAATGAQILPIYVLDDVSPDDWAMGEASRWWLHHSLQSLDASLGGNLQCFRGAAGEVLPALVRESGAKHVFWNRCYEPWRIKRDTALMKTLRASGCNVTSSNAALLFEPHSIVKQDGTPYRVFTPFYRKGCLEGAPPPRAPSPQPSAMKWATTAFGDAVTTLGLLPAIDWYKEMQQIWTPGETAAREKLQSFTKNGLADYDEGRNRPDRSNVSRLSPHLHFGEISPHTVWHMLTNSRQDKAQIDRYLSEIGWREFSYYQLFHSPELPHENLQKKFDRFAWRNDSAELRAWQEGKTGYPIVDAGMRELWRTGYMHNRVRMVVGSFLVKNLLHHWRHGATWFWDTLLDADLANNSAGWQWVAGCGRDAAPYFRIFNPILQGKKFDPDGIYVGKFVPELANVPPRYIHEPFAAPADVLQNAGVTLGDNYPYPIVDLKQSRQRALDTFRETRAEITPSS